MRAFLCRERDGTVIRQVEEVPITVELWQEIEQRMRFLPEPLRDTSFMSAKRVRVWRVDDVGVLFQGGEVWQGLPDVHYLFWDRKNRGREEMCLEMCKVVACDAGSRGVFSAAPVDARVALAFARRMGFQLHSVNNGMALITRLFT